MLQFFLWTSIGQTFIAQRATSYLEGKLNTKVSVEKVDISFFKFFKFKEVYIEDQNQDTLAYIQSLKFKVDYIIIRNDTLKLNFEKVEIENPYYNLYRLNGDSLTNLSFIIKAFSSDNKSSSNLNVLLKSKRVSINNGRFFWNNDNALPNAYGIDWNHIGLTQINLDVDSFRMVNDTFRGTFDYFSWQEKSGFVLDDLTGYATFSSVETHIEKMHLETPYSNINADLKFSYDSLKAYSNFVQDVYMEYAVDTSEISAVDLSYFVPSLEGLDYGVTMFGNEKGPVSKMKFSSIYLKYGQNTILNGRIFITGLPDFENTNFDCRFKNLSTGYYDLKTIKTFPFKEGKTINLPNFLKNAGKIDYLGSFTGFYYDFVTYGTFTSKTGLIKTDLQLAPNDNDEITYNGTIKTTNFQLAEMTGNKNLFNKVSMDISVKGKNLDFKKMDLTVEGKASSLDFLNYNYSGITVDGSIKDQTITGLLSIADTNVNLDFNGSISLSEELPNYKFNAQIENLRPKQLHLIDLDSSASLSTEVAFNFSGNSLDNVLGRAGLRNFYFSEKEDVVELKVVDFIAQAVGKEKTMALTSDNINLQLTGEYYFEEVFQSLKFLTYKWLPSAFIDVPIKPESRQKFTMTLKASQFSGFSKIFIPQIKFESDFYIQAIYDSDKEDLDVISNSSAMSFANFKVNDFNLIAKINLDSFAVQSKVSKLHFTDSTYLENLNLNSTASNNRVKSKVNWDNKKVTENNSGNLFVDIEFIDPENFDITFFKSWIKLNDTIWEVRDKSQVIKEGRNYAFNNVLVSQNTQDFSLNGFISDDSTKQLVVDVDSFNLAMLNPILKKFDLKTSGIMDGSTVVYDFYGEIKLFSNLGFEKLTVNQQKIGNGIINSEWNDKQEKFEIDVSFKSDSLRPITLLGDYFPNRKENQLDLNVELEEFPLKVITPFLKNVVSDITGTLSGKSTITGNLKGILFNGDFMINDASVHIGYLNETMFIDKQKLFIRPTLIGANAVIVKDYKGRSAEINFSLFHKNFKEVNFDLAVTSIDLFRAFNTNKNDNKYFYGDIYLSPGSSLGLSSDYDGNLNIEAVVKSGIGTQVFIPFYNEDEVSEKKHIYFKPVVIDTTTIVEKAVKKDPFKLNLNIGMELTEEADIQLLLDEFTSDKIQAKGAGTINLQINDNGDFRMYGNYEIIDGFYLFTFSKIISKKFNIKPNSRLTWNGSPYDGIADIKASYKVRTSLYELGDVITAAYDTNEIKKRIPVEVLLTMKNNYMNPDLSFSFILPTKYYEIESLLNGLDEGERNKQVFAILILNKFMPISGSDVSSGTSVVSTNTSEVLSNQLSNWLSKINDDVDIGFRYNPSQSATTGDEVEVALSTQLFNDRMLIETNFGFSNNGPSSIQSNNFVGEATVSYKLNKKGNIVGKIFNRSNELNPAYANISAYTQGIGIAYSEPFNTWKQLGCILNNNFRKKTNKRNCEEEYQKSEQENQEENSAKIEKSVIKSRAKQKKRGAKNSKRKAKNEK